MNATSELIGNKEAHSMHHGANKVHPDNGLQWDRKTYCTASQTETEVETVVSH